MSTKRLADVGARLYPRLYRFVWMTDPPKARARAPPSGQAAPPPMSNGAEAPPAPPNPAPAPLPASTKVGAVEVDVPTRDADAIVSGLRATGWHAEDTGRTVSTEDGEDELTTLRIGLGMKAPPQEAPQHGDAPYVRGAIFAPGDLVIGEGVQIEGPVMAGGNVMVGRDATVLGSISAGGDLELRERAVVGDAFAAGTLRMAHSARCNAMVARRYVPPNEGFES